MDVDLEGLDIETRVEVMDHQEKLKELLSQLTAVDDIGTYMNNLIEDYKKIDQAAGATNTNYIKYLKDIDTLSLNEKNTLINYQNLLLEDKGQNASQYWNYLQELVKD